MHTRNDVFTTVLGLREEANSPQLTARSLWFSGQCGRAFRLREVRHTGVVAARKDSLHNASIGCRYPFVAISVDVSRDQQRDSRAIAHSDVVLDRRRPKVATASHLLSLLPANLLYINVARCIPMVPHAH
jgi:hypothetical protein